MSEAIYSSELNGSESERVALSATFDGLWMRSEYDPGYFEGQGLSLDSGADLDAATSWVSFTRHESPTRYQRVILTQGLSDSRSIIGEQQRPSVEDEGYMRVVRSTAVTTLNDAHPIETVTEVVGKLLSNMKLADAVTKQLDVRELEGDHEFGRLNRELTAFTTPAEKYGRSGLGRRVMGWLGIGRVA